MNADKAQYFVGVTGHRHLPQERLNVISSQVMEYFSSEIARKGTDNITVLSALAEGSDTLCAKLALDMGLRLIVPLPMSALEYRKDFSQQAVGDFDCLLSMAEQVFVARPEEPVPPDPNRGFYYRQVGIFVARHCDALLAVWNGSERDTPDGAGTWETVKLVREAGKPIHRVAIEQ